LDVPDLMPGWLLPSWVQPGGEEGARPRDAVRRKRLEQLRELLAAASSEPALSLGTGDDAAAAGGSGSAATSPVDDAGSGSASSSPTSGGTLDVAHSASNAVPFCTGGDRGQGAGSAAPGSTCRAEQAWQVLPWLYTAAGRLDFAAMESVASQLALSGLQLLDVTRYASAATAANGHWHAGLPANIRWAGAAPIPSPAVAAAAALRRMELRRGGALGKLPEVEGKAVVLAYHPQHRQLAAETLALYLHAYLGLGGQEAVQVCFVLVAHADWQAIGLAGLGPGARSAAELLLGCTSHLARPPTYPACPPTCRLLATRWARPPWSRRCVSLWKSWPCWQMAGTVASPWPGPTQGATWRLWEKQVGRQAGRMAVTVADLLSLQAF
jgi:hypothetical protein